MSHPPPVPYSAGCKKTSPANSSRFACTQSNPPRRRRRRRSECEVSERVRVGDSKDECFDEKSGARGGGDESEREKERERERERERRRELIGCSTLFSSRYVT